MRPGWRAGESGEQGEVRSGEDGRRLRGVRALCGVPVRRGCVWFGAFGASSWLGQVMAASGDRGGVLGHVG